MGKIFRLVYGARRSTVVSRETWEAVQRDLQESVIKADISDDIDRDTFVKWSFISAMAVTGAYYDVPMGEVQKPGKVRDTFIGLSQESAALGRKLGIEFKEDIVEYNLKVIDKLAPESTASLQKDMAKGHQSEVQGLSLINIFLKNKSFPSDTNNLPRLVSWIVFYNGTVCINLTLGKRPKFILSFDILHRVIHTEIQCFPIPRTTL